MSTDADVSILTELHVQMQAGFCLVAGVPRGCSTLLLFVYEHNPYTTLCKEE